MSAIGQCGLYWAGAGTAGDVVPNPLDLWAPPHRNVVAVAGRGRCSRLQETGELFMTMLDHEPRPLTQRASAPLDRGAWDRRYGAERRLWSRQPNPYLVEALPSLSPGRALDLGCGEGADAVWLAQHGWDVTGVDFSAVALGRADGLARASNTTVTWVLADLLEYLPPPASFQVVLALRLHFWPEAQRAVLHSAADAVGPGGELVVVGHHPDNLSLGAGGPKDLERLYSPDAVLEALAGTGLEVVRAERVARSRHGNYRTPHPAIETVVRVRRCSEDRVSGGGGPRAAREVCEP